MGCICYCSHTSTKRFKLFARNTALSSSSSLGSRSAPWLGEGLRMPSYLQVSLSCAILCQIVSLQYLSRSSLHYITYINIIILLLIIIIQHFFLRHISSHFDHSEAHYSLKQLHIIKKIMIKFKDKLITCL